MTRIECRIGNEYKNANGNQLNTGVLINLSLVTEGLACAKKLSNLLFTQNNKNKSTCVMSVEQISLCVRNDSGGWCALY